MILDGKKLADKICCDLTDRVKVLKEQGITPRLRIITSGDDEASKVYVRNKVRRAEEIGIDISTQHYDEITQEDAVAEVAGYVMPLIFQLPTTPKDAIDYIGLSSIMRPEEDVDGFMHVENVAALGSGMEPANYPCTPKGVLRLLGEYEIPLEEKSVCIIGRSNIVGRPLAHMMEQMGATVTLCHSKTPRWVLLEAIDDADIVVSAVGDPELFCPVEPVFNSVCADWWGRDNDWGWNKVFVDVGINRNREGKLCGDFPQAILDHAYAYTPVPGGIGPMTVAMLMENVIEYYEGGHDVYS